MHVHAPDEDNDDDGIAEPCQAMHVHAPDEHNDDDGTAEPCHADICAWRHQAMHVHAPDEHNDDDAHNVHVVSWKKKPVVNAISND